VGCTRNNYSQNILIEEKFVEKETVPLPFEADAIDELITQQVIQETQQAVSKEEIVSLPHEILIKENFKLIIQVNGTIKFGDNLIVYKDDGENKLLLDEVFIRTFSKSNLFGINIMEDVGGAFAGYTLIFNIATNEEIQFEKEGLFGFWGFFSIENIFILTFAEKAFAFDDSTGELLWTQTYRQRDGRRIIFNDNHLVIDDMDGNRYKIFGDGRKEILL
jgi:hypothetical protein